MVDRLPEPYRGGCGHDAQSVKDAGIGWGICVLVGFAIVGAAVIGEQVAAWVRAALAG